MGTTRKNGARKACLSPLGGYLRVNLRDNKPIVVLEQEARKPPSTLGFAFIVALPSKLSPCRVEHVLHVKACMALDWVSRVPSNRLWRDTQPAKPAKPTKAWTTIGQSHLLGRGR